MSVPGAASEDEVMALVKRGHTIYKVFSRDKRLVAVKQPYLDGSNIFSKTKLDIINLSFWFRNEIPPGYLFSNYFHAYAYLLKCKATPDD